MFSNFYFYFLFFFIGCSGWLVNNSEENCFTFYSINDSVTNKIKNTTKAIFFTYIAADNNLISRKNEKSIAKPQKCVKKVIHFFHLK